jgi:hypothetical protein
MANRRRDAGREKLWRSRLARQAASRLSVRAFCRREGVAEPSFYAWRRTIVQRDAESKASGSTASGTGPKTSRDRRSSASEPVAVPSLFVPVAVTGQPIGTASIVIELAGGRMLRLPESISSVRLAELVHAIESRGSA